jgi:hypothetical protein
MFSQLQAHSNDISHCDLSFCTGRWSSIHHRAMMALSVGNPHDVLHASATALLIMRVQNKSVGLGRADRFGAAAAAVRNIGLVLAAVICTLACDMVVSHSGMPRVLF